MLQGRALVVAIALLSSGCKIIQTAGQGGDIISQSGNMDCAESQTCTVDVENGTPLNETFTAVPRERFVFAGWKKAPGYLCGGQTGPCATGAIPGSLTSFDVDLYLEPEFYHQPEVISPGAAATEFSLNIDSGAVGTPVLGYKQAVDLNGDGAQDLVITGATYPNEPFEATREGMILLNNGDFTFSEAPGDRPMSVHAREILAADFDGNGLTDIFIADHGWDAEPFPGWNNQLMLQTESGFIEASDRLPDDPDGFTHNAAVGDIDNDGDIDILVLNNGGGPGVPRSYFAINDGTGQFSRSTEFMPDSLIAEDPAIWFSWAAQLADVDGDGYLDMLIGGSSVTNNLSHIFWGNAEGRYSDDARTTLPAPASVAELGPVEVVLTEVTDVDGDGLNDIVLGGYDLAFVGRSLQLLMNSDGRTFEDQTQRRLGDTAFATDEPSPTLVRLIDFNGDGTVDLVPDTNVAGGTARIAAWLNDGTGHYAPLTIEALGNVDETFRLSSSPYVLVSGDFKTIELYEFEGQLGANAGVITEDAVITKPDS